MLWTSDVVKDPWFPLVKDPSEVCPSVLLPPTVDFRVTEPGAVFGELSVLLDQPHTADVRAVTASQFHVADAASLLRATRPRSFTLQRSWRSVSTAPIGASSS